MTSCINDKVDFEKNLLPSILLLTLLTIVSTILITKSYLVLIALHIKKAFGLVDHNILVNKLEHYGIRGVSLKLFSNYQAIDKNMYALIIINPLWQKLNLVYHCRKIGNCITSLTGRLIRIV